MTALTYGLKGQTAYYVTFLDEDDNVFDEVAFQADHLVSLLHLIEDYITAIDSDELSHFTISLEPLS